MCDPFEQLLKYRARQFRRALTPTEDLLWDRIRDRRCGGFKSRRQVVLDRYIADFYCAEAKLLVEVDGAAHDESAERDAERDRWFSLYGYRTLRIASDDIRNRMASVLTRIEHACRIPNTSDIE